jgi:hypothetical protein
MNKMAVRACQDAKGFISHFLSHGEDQTLQMMATESVYNHTQM